jgi:hypothetical protein
MPPKTVMITRLTQSMVSILRPSEPQPADLRKSGADGNASRDVDVGKLVGDKEKDDGKRSKRNFMAGAVEDSRGLWPI